MINSHTMMSWHTLDPDKLGIRVASCEENRKNLPERGRDILGKMEDLFYHLEEGFNKETEKIGMIAIHRGQTIIQEPETTIATMNTTTKDLLIDTLMINMTTTLTNDQITITTETNMTTLIDQIIITAMITILMKRQTMPKTIQEVESNIGMNMKMKETINPQID